MRSPTNGDITENPVESRQRREYLRQVAGSPLDPYADRYAQRTHGMRASEIRALFSVANRPEVVSLAGGMPYVSALPLDAVSEMIADLVATRGASVLQYSGGQGDEHLREQITTVMALEGIEASADDVVVTVGSQQALDLVARVFLDPGDVVLAEAPSYVGALGTFQSAQAEVVHVAMDADGLIPQALEETLIRLTAERRRPKLLYTVPNYHNPGGVTLTEERRDQILEIAARFGVLVLEDNPYGLLGFDEEPHRALRARTDDGVVYLGTFSKTFAPGLRVGWVLAPHTIREKLVLATEAQVLCPPTFSCAVVSAYLDTQPWQEQIKVFRELYRDRRDRNALEPRTADAGRLHLDHAHRRLLCLGHGAWPTRHQGDAAARRARPGRLCSRHRVLCRRSGQPASPALLLLPPSPIGSVRVFAGSPA